MTSAADSRIRVAFCVDNLNIGGTELNAVRLAERLDRTRFDLRLIAMQPDGALADRYRSAGVPIDVFTPGALFAPRAAREGLRLRTHLRKHRIEIFHAHDLYSNLFGCPWARLAGARVIASRRWQGSLPGRAWTIASRLPYRIAHVSLANSPSVADMLESHDGVSRRRIAVIPNFVDEDAFRPLPPAIREALSREFGIAGATATIGIVANLRPVKDHPTLLRAVARLRARWPGLRVVLVGDGESRGSLEQLARDLGICEQIVFAGRRGNNPNLNYLFDIGVLCSVREGFPNSVLEAMAAGRPVVATDVGAVRDAVEPGETGLLVPAGEPEQLATALDELLSDPAKRARMGAEARRRAQNHYSPERALRELEGLYLRLAQRRPDPQRGTIVPSSLTVPGAPVK